MALSDNQKYFIEKMEQVAALLEGIFEQDMSLDDDCFNRNCVGNLKFKDLDIHVFCYESDYPKIQASLNSASVRVGEKLENFSVYEALRYTESPTNIGFSITKDAKRIASDFIKRGLESWTIEHEKLEKRIANRIEHVNKLNTIKEKLLDAFGSGGDYHSEGKAYTKDFGTIKFSNCSGVFIDEQLHVDDAIKVLNLIKKLRSKSGEN